MERLSGTDLERAELTGPSFRSMEILILTAANILVEVNLPLFVSYSNLRGRVIAFLH